MRFRWTVVLGVALIVTSFVAPGAQAQTTDPALLFISAIGTTPTGADPNHLTQAGLRMTYQSSASGGVCTTSGTVNGGDNSLCDPILLILGVPGTSQGTAPTPGTLTYNAGTATISTGGSSVYGGTWQSSGFGGIYNSLIGSSMTVYQSIGLTTPAGASPSENYTNWSTTGNTSWALWVYKLVFTPDFGPGSYVDVAFTGSGLPVGTLAIGYGCDGTKISKSNTLCDATGDMFATPFTQAGLVTGGGNPVPEPTTLFLFGGGSIAAAAYRRRGGARRG